MINKKIKKIDYNKATLWKKKKIITGRSSLENWETVQIQGRRQELGAAAFEWDSEI